MTRNSKKYLLALLANLYNTFQICIIGHDECSQGPHLHWSLLELNGEPKDINNVTVSGFRIKTGSKPYNDYGNCKEKCQPVMTRQEFEESCSTIFTEIDDDGNDDNDKRFCPTITGNYGTFVYI